MAGVIESIDYWSCRRDVGQATAIDETFFGQGLTNGTGEFNDLNAGGELPQQRTGNLMAVMFTHSPQASVAQATYLPATRSTDANTFQEVVEKARVQLFVANVEIQRGSMRFFPGPSLYYYGSPNAAGANSGFENAGYLLATLPHQLAPNNELRVTLTTRVALAVAFSAYGSFITCTLQTKTSRPVG